MSTQTIERMAVEVEGEGDPIVLVHGLGGSSNTWTPQLGILTGRYRIIRPDLKARAAARWARDRFPSMASSTA
jgi:pimeloyl-ACP methyl ester carboxylesterase